MLETILAGLLALAAPTNAKAQTLELTVTRKGFEPNRLTVKKGEPVHLVVTRKTDETCATAIVIHDLGINRALPLDTPVAIDFVPEKSGELRYACGMKMIGGVLLVN